MITAIPRYWSDTLKRSVTIPDGLVSPSDACPECGERDEDMLIWTTATYELLDGSPETSEPYIKCGTCGFCYRPGEKND